MNEEALEDQADIGYEKWCEQLALEFPRVPEYTREAYARVLAHGFPPGGFLRACINNDLFGAISRADPQNRAALHDIVRMIRSTTT